MDAAVKKFFSSSHFAVVGASSDPSKYGHKVFVWYLTHSLPVTPVNPRAASITLPSSSAFYATVPSVAALPFRTETALSIITPPAATRAVLEEAKRVGIKAVWLQPGSFDADGLAFAQREFESAVGGDGGRGGEGWCVLVDGGEGLRAAGREWRSQRL
ncbi:MAG: hypothetical protein M1832_002140 [Thelocarpon impressellum]|nr:MAG: hypothetical protein M1832_002140 [Thelocarpon impressellum]